MSVDPVPGGDAAPQRARPGYFGSRLNCDVDQRWPSAIRPTHQETAIQVSARANSVISPNAWSRQEALRSACTARASWSSALAVLRAELRTSAYVARASW